jgi:hypothetical protein
MARTRYVFTPASVFTRMNRSQAAPVLAVTGRSPPSSSTLASRTPGTSGPAPQAQRARAATQILDVVNSSTMSASHAR